ncbi:MAG: hypothetical protein NT124_05085 [Candidatus Dependentiae bacterium]|nr:hypothetical protein [Candidatus Dependentiae bacterium]
MIPARTIKTLIFTACFLSFSFGIASTIVPGNQGNPSFSFPLKAHIAGPSEGTLYVGADTPGAQEFAISMLSKKENVFVGITPETITLNNIKDQPNPLFNTQIKLLSLIELPVFKPNGPSTEQLVVAVPTANTKSLYLFDNNYKSLLSIPQIPDTSINPLQETSGIVQIATTPQGLVFAAIKPSAEGSTFGDIGSGVALALFTNGLPRTFMLLNATSQPNTSPVLALDINTKQLIIDYNNNGGTLAAILNNAATMHWNDRLKRLFIGLQVRAGANAGARSLIVAHADNGKLTFETIAPDSVFNGGDNKIIGSLAPNATTSIYEVTSQLTSTSKDYLLVRGDTGTGPEARNSVYALPLVSYHENKALVGTIAAKNMPSQQEPATTPEQMTINTDPAAQVGGGSLAARLGIISEIRVVNDTVFAATTENNGVGGGVFYSQALFDNNGMIKRWTQWQRYAGLTESTIGVAIDQYSGNVTTLASTNSDSTISHTQWGKGSPDKTGPLISAIGPVEQLFDFPALVTPGLNIISVLAATYSDQITIAQTGTISNGLILPTLGDAFASKTFDNGTIPENLGTNSTLVTIKGGVLSDISPLTHVAMGKSGSNGWLFVGGTNGLAVLSTTNNAGWTNLRQGFDGLTAGMSFKQLGTYTFIKKLVIDGDYLYVLTDTSLDRIVINTDNLSSDRVEITQLANANQAPFAASCSFFNDLIVSDKLSLIATSNGLYRVGNNNDISKATDSKSVDWTAVEIPENFAGPVTHLYAKSGSGRDQDVARNNFDGQLYVLSADRSRNRAQINRFTIAAVSGPTIIDDQTVQPLPDFFRNTAAEPHTKILSYSYNFGEFRDLFATDGALNFNARAAEFSVPANLQIAPHRLISSGISAGNNIPSMIQNSSLGTWLIGNEKGVYTNE